jgi:hypothetical protein
MAYDYSCKEHYKLQTQTSVMIDMSNQKKRGKSTPIELQLNGTYLPSIEKNSTSGYTKDFSYLELLLLGHINKVGMTYVFIICI